MKPQSIKLFDLFYLGSLFLGLLGFVTGYSTLKRQMMDQAAASGVAISPVVLLVFYGLGALFGLVLWYLVSRQRLILAKWVIVILFLISLIGVGDYFGGSLPLFEIYSLLALIAQAVAVSMLFRNDAIRWLDGKDTDSTPPPPDA